MKKYRKNINGDYRKIYESHFGEIPTDEFGRKFQIHHIDGDPSNNDISNLVALSIKEHFDVHFSQGDWAACLLLSEQMSVSADEISNIARLHAMERVKNGTHNFLGSESNRKRVENGTHNFLGGEIGGDASRRAVANGTHVLLGGEVQRKQILDGKNKLVGGQLQRDTAKRLLEEGKFQTSIVRVCEHCGTTCRGNVFFRYHGDKCKHKI